MTTVTPQLDQIHALLANKGYEVSEVASNVLSVRETGSGVSAKAVLQGDILFFSLTCTVAAAKSITQEVARIMLAADNGISTSHFQLYDMNDGSVAVTLNNFCKLQDMGEEDDDDILSCLHFLFVDVIQARHLLESKLK